MGSRGLAGECRLWRTAIIALIIMPVLFNGFAKAATITADSCSYEDVSSAIDSAESGDTVIVPAGECVWTSSLTLTKSVKFIGAGIDQTTIVNGIVNNRVGDFCIIIRPDNISDNPYIEVTGLTINANHEGGCISIYGKDDSYAYTNFRIHHNKLMNTEDEDDSYMCIRVKGDCFGLIDHNQFINNYYDFKVYGDDQNSWELYPGPTNMGSANFLYIEDNESMGANHFVLTSGEGARWVYRYNVTDVAHVQGILDAHGNTRNDGVVGFEVYENTFTNGLSGTFVDIRGGVGLVYNNDWQVKNGKIQIREEDCYLRKICTYPAEDPISNTYIWNNRKSTYGNVLVYVNQGDDEDYNIIDENRDWWDDSVGSDNREDPLNFFYDVAAKRPSSCNDDDCYWATDTKRLYRCINENNWVFVYTPYKYPHPLRSAPFGVDICAEGQITDECWCEGVRESGYCWHGYYAGENGNCDVNRDAEVNIQDVQCCVNQIIGSQEWSGADVNGDGTTDIQDVQTVVNVVVS